MNQRKIAKQHYHSGGRLKSSQSIGFRCGPLPDPAAISLTASPNAAFADGASALTPNLTARDAQGNAVAGPTISLAGSGGNNTFAQGTGTTAAGGEFSTTLRSTQAQSETLTATLNGNVIINTTVTFVAGPANSGASSLVLSPASQVANNSNVVTATLTFKDPRGRAMVNQPVTFTASGTSTTVTTAANTNASGQTSSTYKPRRRRTKTRW